MAERSGLRMGFVFAVVLGLLCWRIVAKAPLEAELTADSGGYMRMARDLTSGEILSKVKWDNYYDKHVLATRTPAFPALFAMAALFPGGNATRNLTFIHLVLTGLAGLFFLSCFESRKEEAAAGAGFAAAVWAFREYTYLVMPEWSCFLLLVCLSGALVKHFDRPSVRSIGAAGAIICALILSKPVFLIVMPLPFLACSMLPAVRRRIGIGAAVAAILPAFLWMGLNAHRIGEFSLCSYNGYNMFPAARLLGPVPVPEKEPGLFDEFVIHLNTFGRSANKQPSQVGLFDKDEPYSYSNWMNEFNVNMWDVGTKFVITHNLTPVEINALGRRYTLIAWRTRPHEAFWYWLHGISRLRISLLPLCALLVPAVLLAQFAKHRGLTIAAFVAIGIHLAQVVSTAVFAATIPRYVLLTAAPLWALSGPLLAASVALFYAESKNTVRAPRGTVTDPVERSYGGEASP